MNLFKPVFYLITYYLLPLVAYLLLLLLYLAFAINA